MNDPRLEKVRKKDPIIATYTANALLTSPQTVHETYTEHALTHMSLGDTSAYLERLLNWVLVNKGCVVGAVVGPYGYGKTSTAVYLWRECEQQKIIGVPPFKWHSLEELIQATFGWARYKYQQSAPTFIGRLEAIRSRYQQKSIQDIAAERKLSETTLQQMHADGLLNLEFTAEDVLTFYEEVTRLSLEAGFRGLLVFTDELQDTLAAYPTRDKFMNDVFNLTDGLLRREGNYGMLLSMPTPTEALVGAIRPDIIQRAQGRNIYIRAESTYGRHFPKELWTKYATLYGFEKDQFKIIPPETLDAIGQISSRKDLGAGPRTVIDAIVQGVNHYDSTRQPYTPIDLIEDYRRKKIAFEEGGKVVAAVSETLDAQYVKGNTDREKAIKLLAAYPCGCPDDIVNRYGLAAAVEDLVRQLYKEFLYKFSEGYSLRKLGPPDLPPERVFVLFTREFINRYSEDVRHAEMARSAFWDNIVPRIFEQKQRKDQILGWSGSEQRFEGACDPRYPFRKLYLSVVAEQGKLDTATVVDEIGMWVHLDWHCAQEDCGAINKVAENKAVIRLNLLRRPLDKLNIPYLVDFGFPDAKISPMFMLSLVNYLDQNRKNIPNDEQVGDMRVFVTRLLEYSAQLLLGDDLRANSDCPLKHVGLELPKEVFNQICEALYPSYATFITVSGWDKYLGSYMGALKDDRLSLRVLRGRDAFEAPKEEIARIFNQTVLSFDTMAGALSTLLKVEEWKGRERGRIRFLYHPLEQAGLDALRASAEKTKVGGVAALYHQDVFDLGRRLGYSQEEVGKALELLNLRRHLTYNPVTKRFEEVRESVPERQDTLHGKLADLRGNTEKMSVVAGFDANYYLDRIPDLTHQVERAENVEECEAIQQTVHDLFKNINGFIRTSDGQVRADLNGLVSKVDAVLTAGLPRELTEQVQGAVPWVADVRNCQGLLTTKYNKAYADLRRLAGEVKGALSAPAQQIAIENFLALYCKSVEFREKHKELEEERAAANSYLGGYRAWKTLLIEAGRVYGDARNARDNYENDLFVAQLDRFFASVRENFDSAKLEALLDHENARLEISKVSASIEGWLREQRQAFLKFKETCENALGSKMQVEQQMLRTNFDPFDPSGSFEKLYQEVFEKVQERSTAVDRELKRDRNDALYASRILGNDTTVGMALINATWEGFQAVRSTIFTEAIRDVARFDALAARFAEINKALKDIELTLRGVSPKKDPSPDEQAILALLEDPRGQDLRDIIMRFVEASAEEFSLGSLMQYVQSLFQKNQITIRVSKR